MFSRAAIATVLLLACTASAQSQPDSRKFLRDGWHIQSGCKIKDTGEQISTRQFRPHGWIAATVPNTVLAAQVAAGIFKDPYFGMNLRDIPGTTYPIGKMFATMPMPDDSPYACAWWYRTEFAVPPHFHGKQLWLHFGGVNYRANVWLNGKQIANQNDMAGMWREWEFNVTKEAVAGENVLAVQVFAQKENELGITFVDWNPMPPDKDMGLYRPVWLESSHTVRLRNGFVATKLSPDNKQATLSATAELTNESSTPVHGDLRVTLPGSKAPWTVLVELQPHETKVVEAPSATSSALPVVNDPKLWWPYAMGEQPMYDARFDFLVNGTLSDSQNVRFGIRSVTSELTPTGARLFKINGKPFLVRGGGWTPDMMLRQDPQRLHAEFDYVRDMHLNTLRLEGKLETEEFYDLADRMGIMIMAGWCCCDFWEKWPTWQPGDVDVAAASLADQVRRMRNHPSMLVWLNGSDNPPPAEVEQRYIAVLQQYGWPNPFISSATAQETPITGKTGVKMSGPYDWVPPNYWLLDKNQHGGAFSFNTETSPGPAIPTVESIKRMLPREHWWPIDDWWNYHAGAGNFKDMNIFTTALAARYGPAASLEQFTRQSQAAAYDGERAMFEAYTRNRYNSSGIIQWMLNNSWPGMIWHLYDYFLVPGGGYFGAKKANEPLHVMFGYDDGSVTVSNMTQQPATGLRVAARVLNFDLEEKFSKEITLDVGADAVAKALDIPAAIDGLSPTYFVDLRVKDAAGKLVDQNFYWLSTKQDELDWEKTKFFYTPESQYADLTQLASLPAAKVAVQARHTGRTGTVTVQNPGKNLAFMVRLRLTEGERGDDIVPVLWQENYFSLLPGESRTVAFEVPEAAAKARPVVKVDGWNVAAASEPPVHNAAKPAKP